MRWFGRKAGRVAARPFLLRGWGSVGGEPWPRSYEAQVREAFLLNPVAQRAVRLVAEGAAGAPVYALDEKEGASTGSARTVSLVSGPLLESIAVQLLLHGNSFVQILLDAEGEPAELFALRPERVGGGRFRLSRLLRCRRGTEWAAADHEAGESFLLIEREKLVAIEPPAGVLGGEMKLMALGIGDGTSGVTVGRTVKGRALQPPSPVHLRAERGVVGDISISWVRRSRIGWYWLRETDTPLGEEGERYRLVLSGAGFERIVDLGAPRYVYSAALQAEDGLTGALKIRVTQIGTRARSPAAEIIIS